MTTHADLHFLSSTISACCDSIISSLLQLPNLDQMFSWFFERLLRSYCEDEVKCQKRYLEISCEYVGEVHLSFSLIYHYILEQVCDNIVHVSVEFLEEFTASANTISMISVG